jgi:predicted DNA-binding ArsR family transcriptional regulator
MKIYIYLITVLFSSTIFAIESSDILKVSGIYKADHIKLTNLEGYIARAICIKASMLMSHWKVYRVVRPELMSYDSVYTLTSINQSEITKELQAFQKALFNDDYNDISDKDVNKVIDLQQERIASFDLPKNMEYDPLLEEAKTDGCRS